VYCVSIFYTLIHIYYTLMGTAPPLDNFMHYIYTEQMLNTNSIRFCNIYMNGEMKQTDRRKAMKT